MTYNRPLQIAVIIALMALSGHLTAGNVAFDVFPSDLELYEAYLRGEIDYQTYLNLAEIFEDGIDSTELYLLEEIPNISYFLGSLPKEYSAIEREQAEPYLAESRITSGYRRAGYFRIRQYRELDIDGRTKSYARLKSSIHTHWSIGIKYDRDYAGGEQITERTVKFQPDDGPLRKIELGNFKARFGLGLNAGYRGKILDKEDLTLRETIAFPDNGGFNGILVEGGRREDNLKAFFHHDDDDKTSILAGVLDYGRNFGDFSCDAIFSILRLKNKMNGSQYKAYRAGTFFQYAGRDFSAAFEAAFTRGGTRLLEAAIFESRYNAEAFDLKVSVWHYGDDYINPLGGGRAEPLYQTVAIEEVDFSYSEKRLDQRGILLRSESSLSEKFIYEFSCAASGRDADRKSVRLLSALKYQLNHASIFEINLENRQDQIITEELISYEMRGQYRLKLPSLLLRSYLGYSDDKKNNHYLSLFYRSKYHAGNIGTFELWLNLDKYNLDRNQIDYFYGYVKESVNLTEIIELGAKYSYRYGRFYSSQSLSGFWLEVEVIW